MAKFTPEEAFPDDAAPIVEEAGSAAWRPFFRHGCTFGPSHFKDVMLNLIKNPNLNSSWLFRADILYDCEEALSGDLLGVPEGLRHLQTVPAFHGCECRRILVRKLIPRSTRRDRPLDQTCIVYESAPGQVTQRTVVVYFPHVSSVEEMPFYHPKVRAIAFLHEWSPEESRGHVSISFLLFQPSDRSDEKLTRTALQLLSVLHKHGQGRVAGYVKRVNHDALIAQDVFQNRYTELKQKYAGDLIASWAESTDPVKHVFEDLGIAAFLIELWAPMYRDVPFPGFVDIGCGNGLLVYILNQEGYKGWGFDARSRKSWAKYNTQSGSSEDPVDALRRLVLLPSIIEGERGDLGEAQVHDGCFPEGTFIVSNHADELTPWTPILATISDCPFVMIPCCSHDLTGSRHRAPPPKDKTKGASAYASLVEWVYEIARDCGWDTETEMLRIPSTRNTALVGRRRIGPTCSDVDVQETVRKYGGAGGYFQNAVKLLQTGKDH